MIDEKITMKFARRDDCLDQMVPSDLRGLVSERDDADDKATKYRRAIEHLYRLLDDIDTLDDVAKADDALYRRLVRRTKAEKNESGVTTDGQDLFFNGGKL